MACAAWKREARGSQREGWNASSLQYPPGLSLRTSLSSLAVSNSGWIFTALDNDVSQTPISSAPLFLLCPFLPPPDALQCKDNMGAAVLAPWGPAAFHHLLGFSIFTQATRFVPVCFCAVTSQAICPHYFPTLCHSPANKSAQRKLMACLPTALDIPVKTLQWFATQRPSWRPHGFSDHLSKMTSASLPAILVLSVSSGNQTHPASKR